MIMLPKCLNIVSLGCLFFQFSVANFCLLADDTDPLLYIPLSLFSPSLFQYIFFLIG